MTKTTIILDASAYKNSSCRRRLFWDTFTGYNEKIPNVELCWGSALHKFRAMWRADRSKELTAMAAAKKSFVGKTVKVKETKTYLNSDFLMRACTRYAEHYEKDDFLVARLDDGTPLIEPVSRFIFPIYSDNDIELLIAGTQDEIGQWRIAGNYSICDLKTTATWKVRSYLESYALNPQLLLYRWAIKRYAEMYPDSIFAKINKTNVTCFIEGAFYKSEATNGTIEFVRSKEFQFKDSQLVEFESLLMEYAIRLVDDVRKYKANKQLPPREGMLNDSCSTKYGPCKYFGACSSTDSEQMNSYLKNTFDIRFYNPLEWGE